MLSERGMKSHVVEASGMSRKSNSERVGYEKVLLQRLPASVKRVILSERGMKKSFLHGFRDEEKMQF